MDLVRPGHLDDGVHARHRLVVEAKVGRRELPDLDHVLREDLFADQLVPFVDLETDGDIHIGHGCSPLLFWLGKRSGDWTAIASGGRSAEPSRRVRDPLRVLI